MTNTINIYEFIENTKVEGPGIRDAIFLQGCNMKCKGCIAPETWDKEGGKTVKIQTLIDKILENTKIEGITLSGGEPFLQAKPLTKLGKKVKKEKNLSIVTFTGYSLEYLEKEKQYKDLIKITDLLITEPYKQEYQDYSRPWVGSSNQKYHFITKRYENLNLKEIKNKMEIIFKPNGEIITLGIGKQDEIKKIAEKII